MNWLLSRLKESSSWTWLVILCSWFGYTLQPELLEYIVSAAVSIIAIIQFIKKEKSDAPTENPVDSSEEKQ